MLSRVVGPSTRLLPSAARCLSTGADPLPEAVFGDGIIETFTFQDSLPRLPVPDLDKTLDKYLSFSQPLVSADAFTETQAAVEDFRTGAGPSLQEGLKARDASMPHTSYISEIWYDMYLSNRDPFPLNLTPQLIWKDDPNPAKMEQASRAADLVAAAVRFQRSMEVGHLNPDVFYTAGDPHPAVKWAIANIVPKAFAYYPMYFSGGYALDMYQYKNLFFSTRVPHLKTDELRVSPKVRHIVVQRGAQFFSVDVFDEEYRPLSVEAIEAQLRGILEQPEAEAASGYAVGSLTTTDRDTWAGVRDGMETSRVNRASLDAVDSAMFVLTLEDEAPATDAESSRCMLHGGGRNRWFDKCFNIVVCKNGRAGIAWEHAWGDGVAVLNFFNTVYDEIIGRSSRSPVSAAPAKALEWDLSAATKEAIDTAEARLAKQVAECELNIYKTEALNKFDIKKSGLSPDGVMQMALQIAHYRTHGYTPSTYESASTAGFKHGRTETIRSATMESDSLCKLLMASDSDDAAQYAALKAATERHTATTKDCMMGLGADRHLTALENLSNTRGLDTPAMFADNTMQVYRDIRVSTSTLASPALAGGGFGPVSRTSYGVGYGTSEDGCAFHCMSYGLGTEEFCTNAEKALQDIYRLIGVGEGMGK